MNRLHSLLLVLALVCGFSSGCGSSAPTGVETAAELEVYDIHGEIVRILPDELVVVVKHDEIVGWMNAMTMEFPVADPADINRLSEGDLIDAKVHVRDLDYRLAEIRVVSPPESSEP